jgi:hypothetical protein
MPYKYPIIGENERLLKEFKRASNNKPINNQEKEKWEN